MPHPRFDKLAPERRQAILEVAAEEFAAHGFDGASYNRIIEPLQEARDTRRARAAHVRDVALDCTGVLDQIAEHKGLLDRGGGAAFRLALAGPLLEGLGARITPREGRAGKPYRTDQGNFILDCAFGPIEHPEELAARCPQRAWGAGGLFDCNRFSMTVG